MDAMPPAPDAAIADAMQPPSDGGPDAMQPPSDGGPDAMPSGPDAGPFVDGGASIIDAGLTPPADADLSAPMTSGLSPSLGGEQRVAPGSAPAPMTDPADAGGLAP